MEKQIHDLECIFNQSKKLFRNVFSCTMKEDKICAVDICKHYDNYFEHSKYQITPNWLEENKFNITLCYGGVGWNSCASIFVDITLDDVFIFFELIKNTCKKLEEY